MWTIILTGSSYGMPQGYGNYVSHVDVFYPTLEDLKRMHTPQNRPSSLRREAVSTTTGQHVTV